MNIPYKIKDFNLIFDEPLKAKTIEEFSLLERNPNEVFRELTKSHTICDKKEEDTPHEDIQ
jgi:hypothetical protein